MGSETTVLGCGTVVLTAKSIRVQLQLSVGMANSLMKITNTQLLQQFIHDSVDNLIKCEHVSFDSYSSDIEWTSDDYRAAIQFIQNLYRENIGANSNTALSSKIQDLSPQFQECINDCYEVRKNDVLQAIVRENLSETGSLVENIDWKLKWIIGSSKLATLQEPLLQMDLYCFKNENELVRKMVNFEMNLEKVNRLISELQRVKTEFGG